jgi:phosphoglycerol geranylgeranyltransferase
MKNIYQNIVVAKEKNQKLLAILIDPDKTKVTEIENLSQKINQSPATHIFIGGSIVEQICIDSLIIDPSQISNEADGILFLSLLSGRNPDYLIEHHINSVDILSNSTLEIISTGYILIDGGNETAVQRVSQTLPIENTNIDLAYKTAKAGEYLGKKLIYLEAGSGANHHVSLEMIEYVSKNISIPLIVGGGIRQLSKIEEIFKAGADLVVIGTAFENDSNFFTT